MKKLLSSLFITASLLYSVDAVAQDNRISPKVTATETLTNGATITLQYGQPSVKGRTIGVDVEPIDGQLWRTGANEATTIETDKELRVMGQTLPAGKYSLFTIFNDNVVTVIFNKVWNQWGSNNYDVSQDVFRVRAKLAPTETFTEQLQFTVLKEGIVVVEWGNKKFNIHLREN